MTTDIFLGDCLEVMKELPDNSVDMILCDLPYGTTACKWDKIIPFEPLWLAYEGLLMVGGAVVLFASQPFTTALAASNINSFRYTWVWDKVFAGNFVNAHIMPMRTHEDVLVFSFGTKMPDYRPQMTQRETPIKIGGMKPSEAIPIVGRADFKGKVYTEKFPTSILPFSNRDGDRGEHPTQKPVELLSYLIRTYTDKGMTVLDNCMGSGSTGVACVNTERNFIGIEKDEGYFKIAERRIEDAKAGRYLIDIVD